MGKKSKFVSLLLVSMSFLAIKPVSSALKSEVIQMAILLDTSGSMDGLIGQAKTQLWKIQILIRIKKQLI